MPIEAEAGGTCTKHLYKADNVGLGYNGSDDLEDKPLKATFKLKLL